MLKQSIYFEVKKEDRIYQLHLPGDCPLGEIHDVLYQMRSYVVDRVNNAIKQDEPKHLEEKSE